MPNFDFSSKQKARDSIHAAYQGRKNGNVTDAYLEDYAAIGWFLEANKGNEFASRLYGLSARLWELYRYQTDGDQNMPGQTGGRFTAALREVALEYGWKFDQHSMIVLVSGVEGPAYLKWVREGAFFKDDMDAKHGEHSHTLQWLTIARAALGIGLTTSPHLLYRNIFDAEPKQKGTPTLWSTLFDCFPSSIKGGDPVSDTFRSPQVLMQYLLDAAPEDMFIKQYLIRRYERRKWLTYIAPTKSGAPVKRYDAVSGGATMKNSATTKIAQGTGWQTLEKDAAYVRTWDESNYAPKQHTAITCHGVPGYLTAL